LFTWLPAFDATGDERKDPEVGIVHSSLIGPIKVTYAGLQFHPSRAIAWFLHLTVKESKYELGSVQFYVEELFVICIV
jgi:hypothetical protein